MRSLQRLGQVPSEEQDEVEVREQKIELRAGPRQLKRPRASARK